MRPLLVSFLASLCLSEPALAQHASTPRSQQWLSSVTHLPHVSYYFFKSPGNTPLTDEQKRIAKFVRSGCAQYAKEVAPDNLRESIDDRRGAFQERIQLSVSCINESFHSQSGDFKNLHVTWKVNY